MSWPTDIDILESDKTDQTKQKDDHATTHNRIANVVNRLQTELQDFALGDHPMISTGTAVPTLADLKPGSTYFQVDGSGNVIAEWVRADG